MARYVLLRIDDEDQADDLLRDMSVNPHDCLLTPVLENEVSAHIVDDLDWADQTKRGPDDRHIPASLRGAVRASFRRAAELATEWEMRQ